MPWGYAIGAGVSLLGNEMASDKNGGAGAASSSNAPWENAQPWLVQNLNSGYGMQQRMEAQPFSPQQQAAYDNSAGQSDYMRRLIPGLLGQLGEQPVGFDKNNRDARPQAWNWAGLLGSGAPDLGQTSLLDARATAAPAAAPAQQPEEEPGGLFTQQRSAFGAGRGGGTTFDTFQRRRPDAEVGGYGAFKYGQPAPKAGSKAETDMLLYFAMGGKDPWDMYGRGPGGLNAGTSNGDGIGSSSDGDY